MSDETKLCIKCGVPKLLNWFRDARTQVCGTCRNECQRAWRKENPGYLRAWRKKNFEKRAIGARKKKYGITDVEFKSMIAAQNGVCAICSGPPVGWKDLFVDHCHATGKVRGLLCVSCNAALGLFRDTPELLLKACAYLQKFS